jgi:small nuclear ribonucleoprotein E
MSNRPTVVSHHSNHQQHQEHQQHKQQQQRFQKVLLQPIAILFRHLQDRTPVSVWLHDRADMRLEGIIAGFDEYMNVVLEDSKEAYPKQPDKPRRPLGRIMLKGDNICLVQALQ